MRNRHKLGSSNRTAKIIGMVIALLLIGGASVYGLTGQLDRHRQSTDNITELTPSLLGQSRNESVPDQNHTRNSADPAKEKLDPPPIDKNLKRPLAFLVVGIDERRHDSGRTDTIIVLTANPINQTIKMISIPRDTKTELADVSKGAFDKINHAYSRGKGLKSTKKTVERFLGIPIDYTTTINMKGFEQLVDLFGGVKVDVPRDFQTRGYRYTKGPMTLDGKAALYYVRERTGSSDFDRNVRQQQVLRSLINKSARFATLTKIDDILHIIGHNVNTNLTPLQLFQLQRLYGKVCGEDIEQLQLRGTDEWSDAYYFIVDETKKEEVIETLRTHLQLDEAEATPHLKH